MEASSGFQSDWNMNPTICRLCLHSDGFLLGIFNHLHGKDKNIYKKIIDCTALEISSGDGLPHTICHRCLFKLELCLDFRAQCFVSDSTLRQASRLAHAQRTGNSNGTTAEHAPLSLMDLVPAQVGDSGDVVVVVDPSAVDYDSDYDSKYGRPDVNEHYDAPPMAQMAPNIGHYGHQMMMNHAPTDAQIIHDQVASDNETNEIADNGGEIYDFRNVFMCRYCDRAFTDKSQCTRHESDDHDPTEPYSCKTCQLTFPDRLHYSAHLKSLHADDKPYDCPECEKMFARRSDLRKHTIVHTGIKPFTCPVCSKSFSRNTNLSKHMRIHAGHKPFVCPRCPKTFITRGDLQRHSLIHSGRKPFPCRYCNLSFSRRDKLMRHEKRHFPAGVPAVGMVNPNSSSGGGKIKSASKNCDYSGENMVIDIDPIYTAAHETSASLDNTVLENKSSPDRQRHFDSSAVTDHDINGTNDNDNLSGNIDNAPGKSVFYEKVVHKKRKHMKGILMGHVTGDRNEPEEDEHVEEVQRELTPMEKAAKSKRYPCLQCHRRFSNMDGLKFHISQHHNTSTNTSGRPFQCPQCPKGFLRKRELDRHMTTHSGMKPFNCTSCDKRFGRKDKLVRHMRIHDGSNLHVCPICTVAFTRKDSLWQHMRNHQREQQQYHATQLTNVNLTPPQLNDSSTYELPDVNKPPSPIIAQETQPKSPSALQDYSEETLSNSSNFEQMQQKHENSALKDEAVELLDPDFVDTRIDEDIKPILADEEQQTVDSDSALPEKDKERSSEFDAEDEEEEDAEYEDEGEDRRAEEQQENSENVVEIEDDKDLIERQDENSNSENPNIRANSGDPDYDEDPDLEENDEEMGEEEEDDEDGGRQKPQQHTVEIAEQKRPQMQEEGEIIDCDANDSYEEDDNSNQQIQYGATQQQQQQNEEQERKQNSQHDFVDDDLDDDDFEDDDYDDDDDVQMIPPIL